MSDLATSTAPGSEHHALFGRAHHAGQRKLTLRGGAAVALSLAAVAVLAACVPAGYGNYSPAAGRAATPAEVLAVSTAVHASPLTADAGTRPYLVEAIRLSTRTPGYAFATLDPTTPALDGAALALRVIPSKTGQVSWQVFDIGSLHVGCSAPSQVRVEFALHC